MKRLLLAFVLIALPALAQTPQPEPDFSSLSRQEAMIPTRDGVKLYTEIFAPKNASGPLPFLITRTPYGVMDDEHGYARGLRVYQELVREGYIFVFQDIRGRYKSEGKFVMNRPPRTDRNGIDEGTDTYDTIDWLLKNVPNNNGRAGILGISYGGFLTVMSVLEPHPALKAAAEQASPADMFLGDDFHHNGAFRLSYGFEYAAMMETSKENYAFQFDRADTFQWYLNLGALSNVNALYLHSALPTWNDFVAHPNYDQFWQYQAVWAHLTEPKLPILNVAGWWDQEDFWGPMKIYETLEKKDAHNMNYLAAGPWNHGGWSRSTGRVLGDIDFGSNTSEYYRANIQAPWFAYWLKDKGTLPKEAVTFETGSNRWRQFDAWPPRQGITRRKLYLRAAHALSFDAPGSETSNRGQDANDFDSYISDPANPVPYRHRPIYPTYQGPGWGTWLVEDQRFVESRPDTLTWKTAVLDHDITVAGDIVAHLFASTSGSDSDWVVKLIDVYPETFAPNQTDEQKKMSGYELMVADEILRARFRNSFEKPEPTTPNQVTPITVDLHTADHAFLKGHRIMVQVQSTWFPLYDRNPQKFVPNIFEAKDSDYQPATQKIYRSRANASYVELPVEE